MPLSWREVSRLRSLGARAIGQQGPSPSVLVVVEAPELCALVMRGWRKRSDFVCVEDAASALTRLEGGAFAGVVCSRALGGQHDAGFRVLSVALRRQPGLPLAMVVDASDSVTVNRAAALGITLLWQPFSGRHFSSFFERMTARAEGVEHLAASLSALARKWRLRPRENELLMLLVAGHGRASICARTGYGVATYRTYVSRLLARAGCTRTSEVALAVLRSAIALPL